MGMEEESDNALKVLKLDEVKKEVFPPTVDRVGLVEDREGQDEKPVLDHSSFDGHIKVLYKSSVDGYLVDPVDIAEMKRLGLPITEPKKSFFCKLCEVELNSEDTVKSHVAGTPHMKKQLAAVKEKVKDENANISVSDGIRLLKTKKGKQTYYCDLCKLELNSEDTMKTHAAGAPHMKRMVAVMKDGNVMDFIKPIANPLPTRKKQPIRIQQKILESVHKIVGLSYVKECIPCSDSRWSLGTSAICAGSRGRPTACSNTLLEESIARTSLTFSPTTTTRIRLSSPRPSCSSTPRLTMRTSKRKSSAGSRPRTRMSSTRGLLARRRGWRRTEDRASFLTEPRPTSGRQRIQRRWSWRMKSL